MNSILLMMNELFTLTMPNETCTIGMLDEARKNVIMAQESSYKDLLSNLAPRQKVVLQAIAKEGLAQNITSSKFIKKYNLNSASSLKFNSLYIPTLFLYLIDNMIFIQCIYLKIFKQLYIVNPKFSYN